jgi:hypothetical protein
MYDDDDDVEISFAQLMITVQLDCNFELSIFKIILHF